MKGMKKSLLASGVALLASVALLAGTTFAWFTDSVTNTGNRIQAGNLDVELVDENGVPIAEDDPIFDYELWEPGYSTRAKFGVKNNGTLAVKFRMSFKEIMITDGIGDVLDVYRLDNDATTIPEDAVPTCTLADALQGNDQGYTPVYGMDLLLPGETAWLNVAVKMNEQAGNQYQGAAAMFDIQVVATQATSEEDGFHNPNYDADAEYEKIPEDANTVKIDTVDELYDAIENQAEGQTWYIANGVYDLAKDNNEVDALGQTGWLMPLTADNLTIIGVGRAEIKSTAAYPNGSASSQALIGVFGDNITLKNLTIGPKDDPNKNIEVFANNFTMENCTLYGEAAGVYLNGGKETVQIRNNVFRDLTSGVVLDSVEQADSILIEGNTFENISVYAIGNVTWSTPATLNMADVAVNGNTFNNVAYVLRNRMNGCFVLDGANALDGVAMDAARLAQSINAAPHADMTDDQLANRLLATVDGKEVRTGTDLLVGQNTGWTTDTLYDFGWKVNKANTGLDAVLDTEETTIASVTTMLRDAASGEVLQKKDAYLDNWLFGADGVCRYSTWNNDGMMSATFLTGAASDGAYWNATGMTATQSTNPDVTVTVVMSKTGGAAYVVNW